MNIEHSLLLTAVSCYKSLVIPWGFLEHEIKSQILQRYFAASPILTSSIVRPCVHWSYHFRLVWVLLTASRKTTHFKCSLLTTQLLSEIPNNDHKRQNCRVWAHPLGTSMGLMWVCPAHTAPHLTYTCPLWAHLLEKPKGYTVREAVWRKNKKWVIINY